jgi:hypothetical protein
MSRLIALVVAGLMLAACEPKNDSVSQADGAAGKSPDAEERSETVFDPMISTMDRAQSVEGMGNDRKAAMDEAIDGAE